MKVSIEKIVDGLKTSDGGVFVCDPQGNFLTDHMLSNLMTSNISDSVKRQLTFDWVRNHARLILLKLIGYKNHFSRNFRSEVLTPENLMEQLRYRLDREFIDGSRTILRRVSEHDVPPSAPMLLFVSEHNPLRLSDGWYQARFHNTLQLKYFNDLIWRLIS